MDCAPAGKLGIISLELVEINSSVTLSQQYAALGKVAKELGNVYEKSGDETLAKLAPGYYDMKREANYLAKEAEKLTEYDIPILESSAILVDDWLSFTICTGVVMVICWLIGSGIGTWAG